MLDHPDNLTPYSDVNEVLRDLLSSIRGILGDQLVGVYLYGSLATGDFDPHSSDIDFLVATRGPLTGGMFSALAAMHARFAAGASPWAVEIECLYIPQEALRRYTGKNVRYPHIERGSGNLFMAQHDIDWLIQRYVLREYGVALMGPPAYTLIDPVSADDLRRAMAELMSEWWTPMLDATSHLSHRGYRVYATLTMCRVLYTLRYGTVVSKAVAARWAMANGAEPWAGLIREALAWRKDDAGGGAVGVEDVLELVRYTSMRCQAMIEGK